MSAGGRRVLVVEDEVMVAMLVEDMLAEMGHQVVGSAHRLEDGLERAARDEIDIAVLDVNLAGAPSFPIADLLSGRGIPLVFMTGYGTSGLEGRYAGVPVLAKPFLQDALREALAEAVPWQTAGQTPSR